MSISIKNKIIGGNSVFIVAEAGINHNGKLSIAKKLVSKAKEAGADAIKFQTFEASDLTSIHSKYYKIFKKLALNSSDFSEISDYAKSLGIIFFSAPFSNHAVDMLHKLKVPAFKIASGDLTNHPLISYTAKKMKPMILSTGMSNFDEIKQAIKAVQMTGNKKIIIMHSVSAYPTPTNEVNLNSISWLQNKIPYPVGFSDNGKDMLVPIIAVAKGSRIIEKHFTINHKLSGPDHTLSANPKEFLMMVKQIREIEKMLGDDVKKCQPSEIDGLISVRRSITATRQINKGTKITIDMVSPKRPATGIEPKFLPKILGKISKKNILKDQSIQWSDLS